MEELEFIEKNAKVYHLSYGWGVVTSGECGTDFQVKFDSLKQVQSFHSNGIDYDGGVTRSIFQKEVKILEDSSMDKIEVTFDYEKNRVGIFNSKGDRNYLVYAVQALVENISSESNVSFNEALDEIKSIQATMEE